MNKVTRLAVEDAAREAAGTLFRCAPISQRVPFPNDGPIHEFDIYAAGELIGGVSTSPLKTSGGVGTQGALIAHALSFYGSHFGPERSNGFTS